MKLCIGRGKYNPINNILKNILKTTIMKPLDLLLTKEAFDMYATRLREEKAREYGMTLEQWDEAVRSGATISPITPHNNNTQPSSSLSPKQ